MKHSTRFFLALAFLLPLSGAVAQIPDSQSGVRSVAADEPSHAITLARCQYTPEDNACSDASGQSSSRETARETLAQMSRRAGPPMARGPMRYGRGYRSSFSGNGRHAAIGALIGFGIGAPLGAKANKDPHRGVTLKASLLVGFIGSGLGAAIGAGHPSFRARDRLPRIPRHGQRRVEEDQVAGQVMAAGASGN